MRRTSLLVAITLLPTLVSAQATQTLSLRTDSIISVSASRSARAVPDRASFWVAVDGTAETAADASARADAKLKTVSAAIAALGNRAEAERPFAFSIGPVERMNSFPNASVPTQHVARMLIRVHINRPDQLATMVASLVDAGASGISGLTFEASAADSLRRVRVVEAIAQAKRDAEVIATAMGGRLGPAVDVNSQGQQLFPGVSFSQLSFDGRYSGPTAPPEVVITGSVTVRYKLVR